MAKMDRLADEKVQDNLNKFKCWKSDPMPIGEKDRRYLEGGGIHFEGGQYPYCPNPKCRHTLIDQPPGNAIVREQNRLANTAYLQQCEAFKLWKNGQGLQPICQITNTPLEKMPKPPTPLEPMLRCHCSQNRADPRAGLKCAVDCRVNNMQYELGKCPLCKCVCCAFIPLKKYDAIVTATTLGAVQQQNAQAESADWLNSHINVNRMQQRVSAEYYHTAASEGRMDMNGSVIDVIMNEGALAQSLSMLANPPSASATGYLRRKVDQVQDRAGPSFINLGADMNVHGRASAADKRITNNSLEMDAFVPPDMSDADMLQQGIIASNAAAGASAASRGVLSQYVPTNMSEEEMFRHAVIASTRSSGTGQHQATARLHSVHASAVSSSRQSFASSAFTPVDSSVRDDAIAEEDPTPLTIKSTRNYIIEHRHNNRKSMSKEERRASAKAVEALTRKHDKPHDKGFVNCVNKWADLPTPERADEVMAYAEDLSDGK